MQAVASRFASAHVQALLGMFGLDAPVAAASDHPALAWRRSGLMQVTGRADGPGLVSPVAITAAADGALAALKQLAPGQKFPESGAALLGERARMLGLTRLGSISPNGSCHLLRTQNGGIALNLPRWEDWELMPALLGEPAENWRAVAQIVARRDRDALLEQGRLLGLAIAPDAAVRPAPPPLKINWLAAPRQVQRRPVVVDLSALWAGPLAGSLLGMAGARVIKVESSTRPDGARAGEAGFFDLLNAGKASVALDFRNAEDLRQLRHLVAAADIVIESARPRALAALGIAAAQEAARGAVWVSITGHGRSGEAAGWVGFGDDAAVAGGLSAAMRRGWGEALVAGDAMADPLTGITAALAALAAFRAGGGCLISVALADVIADACGLYEAGSEELASWQALALVDHGPFYPLRQSEGRASVFGDDTLRILAEFVSDGSDVDAEPSSA